MLWGVGTPSIQSFSDVSLQQKHHRKSMLGSGLCLVPISQLTASVDHHPLLDLEISPKDDTDNPYQLCLAEQQDLPLLCFFLLQCFGADLISTKNMNQVEETLGMALLIRGFNKFASIFLWAEVLWGLQLRQRQRGRNLDSPTLEGLSYPEKVDTALQKSLLLVVGRNRTNGALFWQSNTEMIAAVELQLQPADGKQPYSWPWLDTLERTIVAQEWPQALLGFPKDRPLQPYLGSLCVDQDYRNQSLGRTLVRCVEDIARQWNYSEVYLHVEMDNPAARSLYQREGYRKADVEGVIRWAPTVNGINASTSSNYMMKNLTKEA